ncbi:MAG: hypothetical protein K2K70_10900, partial [Lachnospiraceae bacterium]|nr:hypothetical protein [Lachnospiraceae bacterium]
FEDSEADELCQPIALNSFAEDEFEDSEADELCQPIALNSFAEDEFEDGEVDESYQSIVHDSYVEDKCGDREDIASQNIDQDTLLNGGIGTQQESENNDKVLLKKTFSKAETVSEDFLLDEGKITMQVLEKMFLHVLSVRHIGKELYYYDGYCYRQGDKEKIKMLIRKNLPMGTMQKIKNMHMYSEVVDYLRINPDLEFDARELPHREERYYISFDNCVVDAKTLNTYEHSEEFPLFFRIHAKYQKKSEETPVFDEFLEDISMGDEDIKQLIYESIGYVFTHSNDAKIFFVWGKAPNSGKSILGELISLYYDEDCVMNISLQDLNERFALGDISQKAVSIQMDLSAESVNAGSVGIIKRLTGDHSIRTDKKFIDATNVIHHMRFIFGTNADIVLKKQDEAFWDRMIIIPFMYSIPRDRQDKDLLSKLLKERDAIASKAVKAVSKVIERNFQFTIPEASRQMWLEWSKNTDSAFQFIMDELIEVTNNEKDRISTEDLYEDYTSTCKEKKVTAISKTHFLNGLESVYGLQKRKVRIHEKKNPVACILGVKRKSEG